MNLVKVRSFLKFLSKYLRDQLVFVYNYLRIFIQNKSKSSNYKIENKFNGKTESIYVKSQPSRRYAQQIQNTIRSKQK